MKKRNTKRALLTSVLSLLLCCSMLIGTTFAWFTDSVESGNNIIKSGNLDIELEYWNGTQWVDVSGKSDILTNTLWEPGVTEVAYLRVANAGSLALKYQLGINIISEIEGVNAAGEVFKLSDYIQFGVVENVNGETGAYATREAAVAAVTGAEKISAGYTKASSMTAGQELYLALVVYMPTSVDNKANHNGTNVPEINLGINIFATQVEAENDSFGDDYDEDAWMPEMQVYSAQDLQAAINNGENNLVLMDDIVLSEAIVIPAAEASTFALRATPVPVKIDLNGKKITIETAYNDADPSANSAVVNYGNVILCGNGSVKAANNYTIRNYGAMVIDGITVENGVMNFSDLTVESGNISNSRSGKHAIYGNNASLTINGGTFHNGNPGNATIFSYGGKAVFNGGEYSIADGTATLGWTSCLIDAQNNAEYTVNDGVFNGEFRDYNKNTTIYGGTFTHASVKNFLAEGYKVSQNDNGVMSVVPAIQSVEDLQNAVNNAANGDTILLVTDIESADGILITDKKITIDLNGNTFTVSEGASTNNRNFKIVGNSEVTIKNGTLIAQGDITSGAYGTVRTEGSAKVVLDGLKLYSYRGYGLNVKANTGTSITINNTEIYAKYSGGVEAAGGEITLNNVVIDQQGVYSGAAWCSVAIGVNGGGKVTVNSGTYTAATIATDSNAAQGTWVAYVMSSGGNLVINGGTFNGNVAQTASEANACGLICADRAAVVDIYGGTFNCNGAILDMRNNVGTQPNPVATLYGGTYSANPTVSGLYSSNLIKVATNYKVAQNENGTWSVVFDGVAVSDAAELEAALAAGENILLTKDITYDAGISLAEGVILNGNGHKITYVGAEGYNLVKMDTGAQLLNVNLENYRVRTESTANGTVTLENVVIVMDNDLTGLDISRGAGVAKLLNVTCKSITDEAHLNPETTVQVDYTPYGDVLLGGAWALEATNCEFGSLHGWNTRNGSSVSLNNTTATVFRMHYWSGRTLYIDGVETAWSESGAIPVAHDVGGCWSVQPAFK